MRDWNWLSAQAEGQFLERKSCYNYSGSRPGRRRASEVARDVAETLAAMANSDGGTLALGIEDDGTPTGVDYPQDRLQVILNAPRDLVRPPLKARHSWVTLGDKYVLVFEVDWSPEVHQLSDGRYLLRVGDKNMPFPAEKIEALKIGKRRRYVEIRPVAEASLGDLSPETLEFLREKTGRSGSDKELLQYYRLVETRNGRLVLTLAALMLFGWEPGRWHPRCGIDFVRFEGTERRHGAELNVIKREWIEAPLA